MNTVKCLQKDIQGNLTRPCKVKEHLSKYVKFQMRPNNGASLVLFAPLKIFYFIQLVLEKLGKVLKECHD